MFLLGGEKKQKYCELEGAKKEVLPQKNGIHQNPVLRRENRIKSIYSSLAIEQNALSLNQVSDVIDGKRVLGPPQDIQEAKNAYAVYERVSEFLLCRSLR